MGFLIERLTNQSPNFYSTIGPFLSRREVVAELGATIWDEDNKQWYTARIDGQIAGFAAVRRTRNCAYLVSAYVLPTFRKRGVYRELLNTRLADLCGEVVRTVATPASVPVLLTAGFEKTGVRGKFTVMVR